MVFKEDVLQWFKELESYERINLMHDLLHMCLPFEIRFLGGCVEEVGKHSFQELRGPSIIANDIDKLSKDVTQLTLGVLDRNCRHRMCIYLSLLENRNCQCAHWYFKQVFRTEQWDEFAMRQKCNDDGVVLNELLMVFTLGRLHPAFNYHQKEFFGDMLQKLYRIRADKSNLDKNPVGMGMPNYPPGFGYPNNLVPPVVGLPQLPQVNVDAVCAVHVKTSSSSTTASQTSTSSSCGSAICGNLPAGDLVTVATPLPQPGMQQHHPQHYQPFEFNSYLYRQQPIYSMDPHMMIPPPQPISPLVSHSSSPPHSRPSSPSPINHSTPSLSSQQQQQQQQQLQQQQHSHSQHNQQQPRSTSSSLRGSKSSSLDSHSSPQPQSPMVPQPMRMPNAPVYVTGQNEVKMGDSEGIPMTMSSSEDKMPCNNSQQHGPGPMLQQDWSNQAPLNILTLHPAHYAFAAHHHQMAPPTAQPPNGIRQCFLANFPPHHQHVSMDQQNARFGYDMDYHLQQQLGEIQLENTLNRSGSSSKSSNNSSNSSSLNQSPPDTPASTPTPAHHGPGRGNRDGGIGGLPEKSRPMNNVNNVTFMTAPPPPISDGVNMPPQQQFTYNVPYTALSGGRQMFTRIGPSFTPSYPAPPPPLTPQQQQQQQQQLHSAQTQAQGPPAYITIGTTSAYVMPPTPIIINSNGNNPITLGTTMHCTNAHTNTASLRSQQHHSTASSTTPQQNANVTSNNSLAAGGAVGSLSSSSTSLQVCTFCCNCGSSEHSDTECTVSHIDDIVTQAGYTLDYDDSSGGNCGGGSAQPPPPQQQQFVIGGATMAGDAIGHRLPDI